MSTLFGLITSGGHALNVHRLAIGVVGNNIANAATPGYSRQSMAMTPDESIRVRNSDILGTGVKQGMISRDFDLFTYKRILSQQSRSSYYEVQEPTLKELNSAYNESEVSGISKGLSSFFTSIDGVSAYPEGTPERSVMLAQGRNLCQKFHMLAKQLVDSRDSLDKRVEDSIEVVNEAARKVATLNQQISVAESGGGSAGNLRDERDQYVRRLSEMADVNITEEVDGSVTLSVSGYVLVQDDIAYQMTGVPDPANSSYVDVYLNGHNLSPIMTGGELAGALSLRDSTIPNYQSDLDNLAFTLVNSFNAQHQAGFGLDGVGGRDFFTPVALANAASNITIDPVVDGNPDAIAASSTAGGVPGDNLNAIELYQLSEQALIGTQTLIANMIGQSSAVGLERQTVEDRSQIEEQVLVELDNIQSSISGVSVDEEATELVKYQTAYQAAARFVSTVKEMMDRLMAM